MVIIRKVGEALTYAHEQGIIHRDVNPNNILLDTSQEPVRPILTDFGLVKPLSADNTQTMTVGLGGYLSLLCPGAVAQSGYHPDDRPLCSGHHLFLKWWLVSVPTRGIFLPCETNI